MKIEIDHETAGGIVRAELASHLDCIKNQQWPSKHKSDIAYEKKVIKAIKLVLDHYGGAP